MQIYRDLVLLSRADYTRTLGNYVAEVSQAPGVLAVFQFGEISNPGISDIDALVVVRDDVAASTLHSVIAATRVDSVSRYLFSHPPVVIPHSSVPSLAYIHSLYNLQQVWGNPIEILPPSESARAHLRLAEYVDFTFAVRTVLRAVADREVGLRGLLLLLTSCVHSLRLASSITGRPLDKGVADRVARLRERSLVGRDGVLISAGAVAGECVEALREADRCLEVHLQARRIISSSPVKECTCHSDGRFYIFETPFRLRSASADGPAPPLGGWWKLIHVDPSVETFPGFYLAQFAAYGSGTGIYATVHRAIFGQRAADRIRDSTYRQLLTTRQQTVQRVHDVVSRGALIPMVPLGIGFRAPDRIRPSRRRRLLRAIVARQTMAGRG